MNVQSEILELRRMLVEWIVLSFSSVDNYVSAHNRDVIVILCAVGLAILIFSGLWIARRSELRRNADAMFAAEILEKSVEDESSPIYPWSPVQSRLEAGPLSIQALADQLRETCLLAERALDGLEKARRAKVVRTLDSHKEVRTRLAKIEAALAGIVARIDASYARNDTIDQKLESLCASSTDSSQRNKRDEAEMSAGPMLDIPETKFFSAQIAEIVRELHEG